MNEKQASRGSSAVKSARFPANLALVALLAGVAVLFRFPPEQYRFYPQCPFYRLTHLYCPGCGATRALAALLHGNLSEAAHFNVLLLVLLPFLLVYFAAAYWRAVRLDTFVWLQLPVPSLKYLLVAASLFTVLRNATANLL